MHESTERIISVLQSQFSDIDFAPFAMSPKRDARNEQTCIIIPPDRLVEVMRFLHDDERCAFEQLCDLTCVDYLNFPKSRDRYGVTYMIQSVTLGHRLWVKCFANDPEPCVPSVTSIWNGAEWTEREVFDLYGVTFTDHPDMRRILTWDGFKAHPLRKDYPLRGLGERENFEVMLRDDT